MLNSTNMFARMKADAAFAALWQASGVTADGGYFVRRRCTIAEINAGVIVLPALLGFKYRVVDMYMIAIGGAVTGATDVRILATQAAASVALMIGVIAALTQSALLRAGAANATILADGASFVANDTNTGITVGKTGGSAATATAVDVFIEFQIDEG